MKTIFLFLFILVGFTSFSQEDSTIVVSDSVVSFDTTNVYVINTTNRLIKVNNSYALIYRDLRSLRDIDTIRFNSAKELDKFFETSFKSLEQGVSITGQNYRVSRNVISKNVIRVENMHDAYFLLTYDTVQKMQTAFHRSVKD
jgi:hypothetical protein